MEFLSNVGLEYISLGQHVDLSGGEAQRIRLAGQLGSGLVGVTYVLDEPSIGCICAIINVSSTPAPAAKPGTATGGRTRRTDLPRGRSRPGTWTRLRLFLGGELALHGSPSYSSRNPKPDLEIPARRSAHPRPATRRVSKRAITLHGVTTNNCATSNQPFPWMSWYASPECPVRQLPGLMDSLRSIWLSAQA